MAASKPGPATIQDKSQRRKPGRPHSGVAMQNRERLLDTALALFSRKGISETSLNAIAREASVTPAMLHYYFHSRDNLLDVIVEERFLPLRIAISDIFTAHSEDPATAITLMVHKLAEAASQHAWFAPLWLQEVTGESATLKQHLHNRFGSSEHARALATIQRWQQCGWLNPQLSPELLFTSILSLILVPFVVLRQRGADAKGAAIDTTIITQHALALLRDGISSPAQT